MEGFGVTESYLRVQVREGFDPLEVQGDLAAIPGYIGSYVVETESVGGGPFFPFDIAVGFNGDEDAVEAAVAAVREHPGVAEARETRNRASVPELVVLPGQDEEEAP
jgi:hypothetical protein